jgi:outer membrane lipoprotein SlyB
MRKSATAVFGIATLGLLAGCAMQPVGPTVRVFPAPYKPFEVFQQDQYECGQYASSQVAGMADRANNRALGTAAIGTALGLALGAATGDGHAATFGGVAGAAVGGTIAADQSERAGFSLQRRYDIAFAQCMYSRGNQVPGFQRSAAPPPPPPDGPGPGVPVPGGRNG